MVEQKVELRKVRDFSDNLNDTFLFIRQNLKPLLTAFLGIAGIFMLLSAIFSGLYQSDFGSLFEQIIRGGRPATSQSPFQFISANYFLVLLFSWMNVTAMQVVIVAYMKSYEEHDGAVPVVDEVWKIFRDNYVKLFIYSVLNAMIMAIGFALCILPGIYFAVVLLPFPAIVMIENLSFNAAFSRCFVIIKDNFLSSLGLYVVVYLIYSFSSGIISAIIGGIGGLLYYFTTKDISSTVAIFTSILSIFSYVFYVVFFVSVVLNYYSLTERFDGTGILKKLDTLGDGPQNFDNIQEQY